MNYVHYQDEARKSGIFALCSVFTTVAVGALGALLYPEGGLQPTDYIAAGMWLCAQLASLSITAGFAAQWHKARKQSQFGLTPFS